MRRRPSAGRRWLALAVLALVAPSCTDKDQARYIGPHEREHFLEHSINEPKEFTYTSTSGSGRLEVRGTMEDDYRYQASVTGPAATYEEVVVDDLRFVKLVDPGLSGKAIAGDASLAPLLQGAWVRDAAGAPPEFALDDSTRLLGPEVVLRAVRTLELPLYKELFTHGLENAVPYDPGSVRYVRRDDKFPAYKDDGHRYDVFPTAYRPDRVFGDGMPDDQQLEERVFTAFLYASVWYHQERVTRIEIFFDVDTERLTRDVRAAAEATAAKNRIPVEQVPVPAVPLPFRHTYTFRYPEHPIPTGIPTPVATVTLPVGSAPV